MFSAHFIPASSGSRFAILHPASGQCRGQIVYLHPLMEEMNKSRRMAALQSRSLSAAGFDVLQIDLMGCGDSTGEFECASWDAWLQDALLAVDWLRARRAHPPAAPLWIWGLRAGALLAADLARMHGKRIGPCNFLFWQPASSGRSLLQQLLRLKTVGQIAQSPNGRTATTKAVGGPGVEQLRSALLRGTCVDIAGYRLGPSLANGLDNTELQPPTISPAPCGPQEPGRVVWLEMSMRQEPALLPASQAAIQRWIRAGYAVQADCIQGPTFWQTTEIEEAHELVLATNTRLTGDTVATKSLTSELA